MKRLLIHLGVLVCGAAAHAVEMRILAWDGAVAERPLVWVHGEKTTDILDLHPLKRSKAYPGPAKDAPVVIRALDRPQKDGKPEAEFQCAVAPGLRRPLLILLPDPVAPSGLRGLVIEDDASSFAWGTMRFLNASGQEVVVQVDQKAVKVPTGWKPVDLRPEGSSRNLGIRIALAATIETPAYTSVWEHREDSRSLLFVLRGADSRLGSLMVKAIPEMKGVENDATVTKAE